MSEEVHPSPSGTPTSRFNEEDPIASPIGTPSSNVGGPPPPAASPPPTGELPSNLLERRTVETISKPLPRRFKRKIKVKTVERDLEDRLLVHGVPIDALETLVTEVIASREDLVTKREVVVRRGGIDIEALHYPMTIPPDDWHDPRVAVNILTLLRPNFLDQCLASIAKYKTPFQVFIVNQGDNSPAQRKVIDYWIEEIGVIEHYNDPPKWPGPARAEAFTLRQREGYELIITFDDDCLLIDNGINKLVKAADENPEFHAISGYLIVPRKRGLQKYLLGGKITPDPHKYRYKNLDWVPGVHETDYICNGFRLVRLNPLILPDREYTMGLTDFDWSAAAKNYGMRLAVCGEAGAYHKVMFKDGKPFFKDNPMGYHKIRRNRKLIMAMKQRFMAKWGYRI